MSTPLVLKPAFASLAGNACILFSLAGIKDPTVRMVTAALVFVALSCVMYHSRFRLLWSWNKFRAVVCWFFVLFVSSVMAFCCFIVAQFLFRAK